MNSELPCRFALMAILSFAAHAVGAAPMRVDIAPNGHCQHARLLRRCISSRIPVEFGSGGLKIYLSIDENLGRAESFTIVKSGDGWTITGTDELGLYYGIGRFLHRARWTADGFHPETTATLHAFLFLLAMRGMIAQMEFRGQAGALDLSGTAASPFRRPSKSIPSPTKERSAMWPT